MASAEHYAKGSIIIFGEGLVDVNDPNAFKVIKTWISDAMGQRHICNFWLTS